MATTDYDLAFMDYEEEDLRSKPDIRAQVILYHRVFDIPINFESSIPARGATVTLRDVSDTGIETPRMYSWRLGRASPDKPGTIRVQATFYQIRTYA